MPSARFPFLKDPKPPAAALDIVEHAARHNPYSPFSPMACPLAPKQLMPPKRPFDIKMPWIIKTVRSDAETSKSFMETVLIEYRETFPEVAKPSTVDLVRWYRQRALDAEAHSAGLDTEVNRLEDVNGRLEKEIGQMEIDYRIRSASHGV